MSIILVTGFGRCGSSLVMQMLHAGGVDCTGTYPAFEDPAGGFGGPFHRGNVAAAAGFAGKAIKVLDPQEGRLPPGLPYRAIWCRRDFREQARSQVKLLRMVMGVPAGREEARRFERSYASDLPKAINSLRSAGIRRFMDVRFEDTLASPQRIARELAVWCELPAEAAPKMAAAVRRRSPECAPGMDMELSLMEAGDASS